MVVNGFCMRVVIRSVKRGVNNDRGKTVEKAVKMTVKTTVKRDVKNGVRRRGVTLLGIEDSGRGDPAGARHATTLARFQSRQSDVQKDRWMCGPRAVPPFEWREEHSLV